MARTPREFRIKNQIKRMFTLGYLHFNTSSLGESFRINKCLTGFFVCSVIALQQTTVNKVLMMQFKGHKHF